MSCDHMGCCPQCADKVRELTYKLDQAAVDVVSLYEKNLELTGKLNAVADRVLVSAEKYGDLMDKYLKLKTDTGEG